MSEISDMIRTTFKEGDDQRDAGLTTPDNIVRFDDIVYGSDAKWQSLDVYRPKEMEGKPLPVIVSVHGGGWVYGDKERYSFYCMNLAQRGFAVVNFTYRLAPEYKFPSSLEDTCMVFDWVLSHATEYGFDTNHIFGVGDSAGAHLLGLFCGMCSNKEYANHFEFQAPKGFVPTAVALNCGAYEIEMSGDPKDMDSAIMKDLLPNKGTKEELEQINVVHTVTANYPPTFYTTCTGDFLVQHAPKLGKALIENQVPHEFHYYGDCSHELGHVFMLRIREQEAIRCNDEECVFFRKFL